MVVQFVPSGDVWIWKAVAYAASHCSTTWLIDAVPPRSTCSHCGSLNALDQRVPGLPSTALDAGSDAFSVDDAVAVFPCDSRAAAALALRAVPRIAATSASAATGGTRTRERGCRPAAVVGLMAARSMIRPRLT